MTREHQASILYYKNTLESHVVRSTLSFTSSLERINAIPDLITWLEPWVDSTLEFITVFISRAPEKILKLIFILKILLVSTLPPESQDLHCTRSDICVGEIRKKINFLKSLVWWQENDQAASGINSALQKHS